MSYIPITIQKQNPETERWEDFLHLHALKVNKSGGGESHSAGAGQFHYGLTFELRYSKALESVIYSPQTHRIMYRGHAFNITDYDDFMESHKTVRLTGEAYG